MGSFNTSSVVAVSSIPVLRRQAKTCRQPSTSPTERHISRRQREWLLRVVPCRIQTLHTIVFYIYVKKRMRAAGKWRRSQRLAWQWLRRF